MSDEAATVATEIIRRAAIRDPELVAMQKVLALVEALTPQEGLRVLAWNRDRIMTSLPAPASEVGKMLAGGPGVVRLGAEPVRSFD